MAEYKHGTVTITVPDELMPAAPAGNLDTRDVSRIPKAPRGLGQICDDSADALEKAGAQFLPPQGVTPESLRTAGRRADKFDQVLQDGEVAFSVFRQASILAKAEAYEQVRKVNDLVRAQGKHNPGLLVIFQRLIDFFVRLRKRKTPPSSPPPTSPPVASF